MVNVPYDPWLPMIFQGEEMSITLRGFTVGYDFYTPERSVCFHHYERKHQPSGFFYENEKRYRDDLSIGAMERLLGIVHMNPEVELSQWNHRDETVYGLGGVRTPEKFYDTFGIDVFNKKLQHHLCKWVNGPAELGMHKEFTPYLRKDGMGIDYDLIEFEFVDVFTDEKDDEANDDDSEETEVADDD